MKRTIRIFFLLGIVGLGVWYFAIKKEHYQISFQTIQPTGIVYHHILEWRPESSPDITNIKVLSKVPYSMVEQRVEVGDSIFNYIWEFSKKDDTLTRVNVRIKDEKNGMVQKFQVPFMKNDFVKRSISNVKLVADVLALNRKKFKVHSIKDTVFPGSYCVYLPLKSSVANKSATMLYSIVDIMGYVKDNNISLTGDPYLEVTEWNQENDQISYNFCFPIPKLDSLPPTDKLYFKETPSFKALKAEFNGNYSISDKAWYYLLEHAERKGLKVKNNPTELFLNDPHTSSASSMDWKANIYLPLEE